MDFSKIFFQGHPVKKYFKELPGEKLKILCHGLTATNGDFFLILQRLYTKKFLLQNIFEGFNGKKRWTS